MINSARFLAFPESAPSNRSDEGEAEDAEISGEHGVDDEGETR